MINKKKTYHAIGLGFLNLVFIIICIISLIPILYAVSLSISGSGGALSSNISFIPEHPTLANYRDILVEEPFLLWLKNSVVLSIGTMVVAMGTALTAAYAFSRYRFRGRMAVLQMLLILNAFPQIANSARTVRLF